MAKNNKSEASKTPKLVPNKSAVAAAPARSEAMTPRPPQPSSDPESFERLNELVRIRAYQLYEQRGRGEGLGLEAQDWLQAEQEVMEQYRKRTA
jgi:hypothetical protein